MRNTGLLFLLLLISSCEKDFNINPGSTANEMVVNSLWNDAGPMVVFVSKPYPVNAPNSYITSIPDARVELYEDSIFKEVLHYIPSDTQAAFGSYFSNLVPKQGKSYTIKAFEPNYLNATATDAVPVQAQLITSSLETYVDSGTNPSGKMYMVFRDNPNVQNYYRINAWLDGIKMNVSPSGDTVYSHDFYAIEPFPLSPVNDTVRDGYFLLFSDRGFNGQEKNLWLSFFAWDRKIFESATLYIELHTVSYAHYKYFQTLNMYRTTNTYNEPVYIYDNVNNGLGAFVAEHIQSMPFVLK